MPHWLFAFDAAGMASLRALALLDAHPHESAAQTASSLSRTCRGDAVLSSFHRATELVDGPDGIVRVDLDDGPHVVARTLLVATGAQWRTLDVDGIDRFNGAGVYHVAMATDAPLRG